MGHLRIKSWNIKGFEEIRRSVEVASLVNNHAAEVCSRANSMAKRGTYRWSGMQRRSRYGALVVTDDYQSRIDNAKRSTLLKALGS